MQLLILLIHHRLHAIAKQQGQPDTGMTGGIDRSLVCECRSILFAGAPEDLAVVGWARQLAEPSASVALAGHDEAAGAARQALASAALQQPARHEVLIECILLINGVKAVNDNVLADLIAWMDDDTDALLQSRARCGLSACAFCLDSA